jgi:RNA polymerase sigma-70 factor (ECF subfamily)
MSDEKLVELYRAHGGAVYARCRRILGDGPAAEDATQETFLRVHRHLAKAPDAAEALAWIYRIATNYCLNEIRNRRTRPEPVGELTERMGGELRLEQVLADRQRALLVMSQLPEKLRAVAWLHHVDGMDQGEVARVLGVSRRTVVYRLADFQERAQRILDRVVPTGSARRHPPRGG